MKALLVILTVAMGTLLALAVEDGASAVLICTSASLVAASFLYISGPHRGFLLRLFVVALLVRALVGTAIYVFGAQEFFGGDALTYDYQGQLMLDFWHRVSPAGIADELGGSVAGKGMMYLVAGIYAVTGRNLLAVQLSSTRPSARPRPR